MPTGGIDLGKSGKGVAYVYVSDRKRALGFYRDTLGLELVSSDPFGDAFELAGTMLRVMAMPDAKPHAHPVLGFEVDDLVSTAEALRERGVTFDIFDGMGQDALGVWTSENGKTKLAFFKDADGNALTLSQHG